jgi:hypothetical protein
MTQAKLKFASFEEYLSWSDDPNNYMEGDYELIDGEQFSGVPQFSSVDTDSSTNLKCRELAL